KAFWDSASSVNSTFATYFLQSPKEHYILNLHAPDRRFFDTDSGILKVSKYELGGWDNPIEVFNFWVDAELFSGEGVLLSRHKGRLKQHGAGSSFGTMKSMRLHLSESQAIIEPIYRQKPELKSHRVIILRQGGNSSDWVGLAMQDVLTSEYLSRKDWDLDYQAYQPVNVYINGQFHALMFFRERHDEYYFANNHQADPDQVSVVRKFGNSGEIDTGGPQRFYNIESLFSSSNFRDTASVNEFAKRVDFDNYFKYLYLNDYISNNDWPFNNFKIAHPGGSTDKWRFCVYDTDFAYQNLGASGIVMLMGSLESGFWLPKLMQNDSMREYFINYYLDLLNTEFDATEFEESLDFLVQYLGQDVQDHLLHWRPIIQANNGGAHSWEEYIESLRSPLAQRNQAARSSISAAFKLGRQIPLQLEISPSSAGHIQLNTLDLQDFPWTGIYLEKNPVYVTAIARPGYRFVGWTDPLLPDSNHLRYELDASCTLTAIFEVDSSYQPKLVINEIMYADIPSRKGGDWVELYNASDAPIDLDQWALGDQTSNNRFAFPPGTTISPDQYLVICRDPSAFLGAFPGTSIVPRSLGFGLGRSDAVRIWNQDGQLVDIVTYSNEAPWPQIADAQGGSLALRDPQLKINYPENWISRTDYSPTPGSQNDIITALLTQNRLSCIRFNAELFPNPMQSDFTLYFENSLTESIDLQFLDLLGREVHTQRIPLRLGANLVKVPVDFLAQGHYILKMEQDGMTETVRIVKN
ncbi:MAG: lamin tail domain-containing protein, partial [Bacteroidia bacterium]